MQDKKDLIIDSLNCRIEELLSEKNDVICESNNLEREVDRLKKVCLNISTEMTASKMSNWNLSNPEELYEIEQGINERLQQKREIERKERVILRLKEKNRQLHNRYKKGRDSLKKIKNILNNQSEKLNIKPELLFRPITEKECGGFGMFTPSPPPV